MVTANAHATSLQAPPTKPGLQAGCENGFPPLEKPRLRGTEGNAAGGGVAASPVPWLCHQPARGNPGWGERCHTAGQEGTTARGWHGAPELGTHSGAMEGGFVAVPLFLRSPDRRAQLWLFVPPSAAFCCCLSF